MLLEHKRAVIYGAGGAIGGAVALPSPARGHGCFSRVALWPRSTRWPGNLRRGRTVETAQVDALDEPSVEQYIADVAKTAGGTTVSFNAIGLEDVQGRPLIEMSLEDFSHPITIATSTQFLTAKAVAPGGSASRWLQRGVRHHRGSFPQPGGRAWAKGVRVICLRSAASPESIAEVLEVYAAGHRVTRDEFIASLKDMTLPEKTAFRADVGTWPS